MTSRHKGRPRLVQWVLCYGLFAVVVVLAYFVFTTTRNAASAIAYYLTRNEVPTDQQYTVASATLIYSLIIGIAMFIVVMAAEPSLRRVADQTDRLTGRFLRFAVPLLVAIVVAIIVQVVIRRVT